MTWPELLPLLVATTALVTAPGLLVGFALRLRGIWLLGFAPLLSVAVVGGASVLAPLAGLRWGWTTLALATAVAALVAFVPGWLVELVTRRRERRTRPVLDHGGVAALLAGTGIAAVLAFVTVRLALGRPDMVPQGFDTIFHLNAVRFVLDTGDASPTAVARLNSPGGTNFYPAAWHALAALLAEVPLPVGPASSPLLAGNALLVVVPAVVWSLSAAVLVRAVVGARPLAVFAAAVLGQGFVAFPWYVDRGGLWPFVLGTALIPATVAAVVVTTARGVGVADRVRAGLVAVAGAGATATAHPSAFVVTVLLVVLLLVVTVLPRALLPWRGVRDQWVVLGLAVLGSGLAVGVGVVLWPSLAGVRAGQWPVDRSVPVAVGEALLGAPAGAGASWVVAGLVLVGLVRAALVPAWRWVAAGHLVLCTLDVLAASVDAPWKPLVTGVWYNDRGRLAASEPVTGVVLAVLAVLWIAAALHRRRSVRATAGIVAVGLVLTTVPQVRGNAEQVAKTSVEAAEAPGYSLVSEAEQRFLTDLDRYVPEGEVVAGTPWDGSSLAYALSGVEVLFPHLRGNWTPDAVLLADRLQDAAADPEVCAALERERVRYVIDDGELWDPPGLVPAGYTAFRLFQGRPGFTEVASGGGVTLYRITACSLG
ncbi:DUF6541 family protein [Kineococcus gynurae]|uniref:DUF6541 family protein n=1 Tax=Kineococcus gynurae TaxID=452979 RepID=A0ABV5LRI4_9ACTN